MVGDKVHSMEAFDAPQLGSVRCTHPLGFTVRLLVTYDEGAVPVGTLVQHIQVSGSASANVRPKLGVASPVLYTVNDTDEQGPDLRIRCGLQLDMDERARGGMSVTAVRLLHGQRGLSAHFLISAIQLCTLLHSFS